MNTRLNKMVCSPSYLEEDALSRRRRGFGTGLLIATLAAIVLYWVHAIAVGYVVDDAYISFQYAKNFAMGNGFVYNVGERVEGYTNFLWVLALGLFAKVWPEADLLVIARVSAIAIGTFTILLMVRWPWNSSGGSTWKNSAAAFMLACNTSFCAWSMGGLATTMFTFLILASVYFHSREFDRGGGTFRTALVVAIASLVRADGFVVFAILSCARCHEHFRRRESVWSKKTFVWFATFVAVIAPYVAWRFWYYGDPLPNTYYAKVGGGIDQYLRGARHLKGFLENYGGVILIPIMAVPFVFPCKETWVRCALWVVGGWVAYIVKVGGDGLAYFRFFGCIAPLIYLLAQQGILSMGEWFGSLNPRPFLWRLRLAGVSLVALLAVLGAQQTNVILRHKKPDIAPYKNFDNYFVDRCKEAGLWLADNSKPNAVVASTPAGAIAFYSERTVIDMLGLTDKHIARQPVQGIGQGRAGHERGDGAYVLSRKPDYILLGNIAVGREPMDDSQIASVLCQRSEHEIWELPEFRSNYERKTVRLADTGLFQYFTFYQRKP